MTERATGAIVEPEVLDDQVERLRKNIDAVDEAIISLVKERRQYSAGIRRVKRRQGRPGVDLTRESVVHRRYMDELGGVGSLVSSAVLTYSKSEGPLS